MDDVSRNYCLFCIINHHKIPWKIGTISFYNRNVSHEFGGFFVGFLFSDVGFYNDVFIRHK